MKQYLISMYQPDGPGRPAPEVLQKIMQEIYAIRSELQASSEFQCDIDRCTDRHLNHERARSVVRDLNRHQVSSRREGWNSKVLHKSW